MPKIKLFLLALLFAGVLNFFPGRALAGSCQCNGWIIGEAQATLDEMCIKEGSTEAIGQPITSQNDCNLISERIAPNLDTSITCIFDDTSECDGINLCKGRPCYPVDEDCKQDSDCTKWQADACVGVKDCAFASACKAEVCYLDNASLNRYKNTPKILGITPQLQLSQPKFEVSFPGFKFTDLQNSIDSNGNLHIPYLGEFLSYLYKFAMGAGSIVAIVMIVIQGARVVISGGGAGKTEAYQRIGQIVIGLVILWGSYAILYSINPELVQFRALSVEYIKPEAVPDRISGGEETSDAPIVITSKKTGSGGGNTQTIKLGKGKGNSDAADLISCPDLTPGTPFKGAFTTYHTISHDLYGQPMGYRGSYIRDSILGLDPNMGDFYCAVSMECGCPKKAENGNGYGPQACRNSKRTWPICNSFPQNANWCDNNAKQYTAGATVAASSCFPTGCKIEVNGHVLRVSDRGSGIIGTHFDLYVGQVGGSDLISDTSWLTTDVKLVDCPPPKEPAWSNTKKTLQAKYNRYKPGVCTPGKNC